MKQQADAIEAKLFGAGGHPASIRGLWMRQKSVDGQAIIHADGGRTKGATSSGVRSSTSTRTATSSSGSTPPPATLREGYWGLAAAEVVTPGLRDPDGRRPICWRPTLTPSEVAQAFVAPETVSFWNLPGARRADRARRPRRHGLSSALSRTSGAPADARGDGSGGRLFFVKILPNGRRRLSWFPVASRQASCFMSRRKWSAISAAPASSARLSRAGRRRVVGCLFGVYVLLHQEDG